MNENKYYYYTHKNVSQHLAQTGMNNIELS